MCPQPGCWGRVPATPLTQQQGTLGLIGGGRGLRQGSTALPSEGTNTAPLCPDESDYLTECEEGLPEGPQEAYADFQSSPADGGSDWVSCLGPPGPPPHLHEAQGQGRLRGARQCPPRPRPCVCFQEDEPSLCRQRPSVAAPRPPPDASPPWLSGRDGERPPSDAP